MLLEAAPDKLDQEAVFAFREALIEKEEALIPELQDYLFPTESGHQIIHHPILIEQLFAEGRFAFVNYMYRQRVEIIEKALAEQDWFNYFISHENPYRLKALNEIANEMSNHDYWEELGVILCRSENLFEQQRLVRRLVMSDRPERQFMMDETERGEIAELPSELTVYRGYSIKKRSRAWSWTLDKEKAEWFARRCRVQGIKSGQPRIAQGKARKDEIVAYFSRRKESEIVVDPKLVSEISDTRVN